MLETICTAFGPSPFSPIHVCIVYIITAIIMNLFEMNYVKTKSFSIS
jgi:hypothetical protein